MVGLDRGRDMPPGLVEPDREPARPAEQVDRHWPRDGCLVGGDEQPGPDWHEPVADLDGAFADHRCTGALSTVDARAGLGSSARRWPMWRVPSPVSISTIRRPIQQRI